MNVFLNGELLSRDIRSANIRIADITDWPYIFNIEGN
jgi:hypothetical protein